MDQLKIADRVAIVGIGETEYTRWGRAAKSEFGLACEAILKAVADAGLTIDQVDGFAGYSADRNDPIAIAAALGIPQVRYASMVWGGGGGGSAAAVGNAAAGIVAGYANYVVAFRALAQGQFGRFGQAGGYSGKGRTAGERIPGGAFTYSSMHGPFSYPFGLMTPAQHLAMYMRRHMHLYGTTSRQMGAVAVAARKHAQYNTRAVMYGRPMTIEDHQNSRLIADPFRLLDCCLETDGAAAVVLTSAERARDLPQRPVYLMGAAQGGPQFGAHNQEHYASGNFREVARDLWAQCGIQPKDVDVAQIYDHFTGHVITSLEDHGFCGLGEGGAFVEGGRIEIGGELPINTSGGNLSEAYVHGFGLAVEGVRQLRGTSTCQVPDAEICLVAGGAASAPVSSFVIRR
ncbi:MAG TPA: acetyl-CoA acetyltransferase [Dehalococcoidia bacterium]|nr:acetyl-CoA acetyltransferase [Dehalococcoidia bacterium]